MGESAPDAREATDDSLSQLAARVLNQLSLSAWLPAAALVLLNAFILAIGASLDAGTRHGPGRVLTAAIARLASLSFTALLLVFAVIVVMTMLTQAFSFGAIRFLEGYWGPSLALGSVADRLASRQRFRISRLERRYANYVDWDAEQVVLMAEAERTQQGLSVFGSRELDALRELARGYDPPQMHPVAEGELHRLRKYWDEHKSKDVPRHRLTIDLSLDDYPEERRNVMPTRFGNILRRYEDEVQEKAQVPSIEGFVDRYFDTMPFSLRVAHDEQRTRLDLYCSMVFVIMVSTCVATARFGTAHWTYALTATVSGAIATWLTYRAALASARYYGSLLSQMADIVVARRLAPTAATGLSSKARVWRHVLGKSG